MPDSANRGTGTVVNRGVAYAAMKPGPAHTARPKLSALRGSAKGCYGNVQEFVDRLRDEW